MEEATWLGCIDPLPMLDYIAGAVTDRKYRLFAVACCRRVEHLLADPRVTKALEAAEAFADGDAVEADLETSSNAIAPVCRGLRSRARKGHKSGDRGRIDLLSVEESAAEAVATICFTGPQRYQGFRDSTRLTARAAAGDRAWDEDEFFNLCLQDHPDPGKHNLTTEGRAFLQAVVEEHAIQCEFLRDIVGNPFRPVAPEQTWLTNEVISLARTMYESRNFKAMPQLANALQDAGCNDDSILSHCRCKRTPHVRGCCVLDLILNKDT